eukprot:GILK01003500.1.p1 GENE.GILK01003500.1~~GILK01003500.1.p1  ORF type:complete len:878 (-),score=175.73 GILK01003500.1:57-2477(-)
MHAVDLEFNSTCLDGVQPETVAIDKDTQTVSFLFKSEIAVGKYVLTIDYKGPINEQLCGFYRSSYVVNGEKRFLGVTQFEATDARRALPCWDEPAVKAVFVLTMVAPAQRIAVSNMPVMELRTRADGRREYLFAPSPIMSTYLLAFVVGEFDFVSATTSSGTSVRVYTPLGKADLGRFSLAVAVQAIPFYEKLFDIKYPLPKMDLLAIPDFAAGAMENWGCVTYRETALLIDPVHTSTAVKQRVSRTVCHEIAHMWFGNLVTMQWWTHLWLNEGFARYVEHLAVDHIFPAWGIWQQYVSTVYGRALVLDALKTSHPIEVPVKHPDEVNEIFDTISYAKGSSVIRMLSDYLGRDVFTKALSSYLARHAYSNAETPHLWAALEEASNQPVSQIMQNWTSLVGYPYITVEEINSSVPNSRQFRLTQRRFYSSGDSDASDVIWHVPIRVVTRSGGRQVFLLKTREDVFTVSADGSEWIKFNAEQTGFYRVLYSTQMLDQLKAAVERQELSSTDRLGLQSDAYALSCAGHLPMAQVLDLWTRYKHETDLSVWLDIATNVEELHKLYAEEPFYPHLQRFTKSLFEKVAQGMGWEAKPQEPENDAMLRSVVLSMMARGGDEQTVTMCRNLLAAGWKQIPADLRYLVFSTVVENGGQAEFDAVQSIMLSTDLAEEKRRAMRALTCSTDSIRLSALLDSGMTGTDVRDQDKPLLLSALGVNPKATGLLWRYFKEHFGEFKEKFSKGQSFLLSGIVSAVTEHFKTEADADDVTSFFSANPLPSADRTIRQSIEQVRCHAKLVSTERVGLSEYLKSY